MNLKNNKRGIEIGLLTFLGMIILLLSAAIIIFVLKGQSTKFNEQLEIDLCRLSNEINFGLQDSTGGLIGHQQICKTIDKSGKNQIPTKKYQGSEGALRETREMIRSCWWMWLEGSQSDVFRKIPFTEGCFTCYTFKLKEKDKGFTSSSLINLMDETYFVVDSSDKCTFAGSGGYWREGGCGDDEKSVGDRYGARYLPGLAIKPKKEFCCVSDDIRNECENKGETNICAASSPGSDYILYDEWRCPRRQNCYVKDNDEEKNIFSYTDYIRRFGARGGEIFFIPPSGNEVTNINYVPNKIYAVSFVSPNKVICDGLEKCVASIGNNWYVPVGIGVAGLGIAAGSVIYGSAAVLGFLGKAAFEIAIFAPVATTLAGSMAFFNLDEVATAGLNLLADPISTEVPNFIIVSTKDHADQLGCTINYGQ